MGAVLLSGIRRPGPVPGRFLSSPVRRRPTQDERSRVARPAKKTKTAAAKKAVPARAPVKKTHAKKAGAKTVPVKKAAATKPAAAAKKTPATKPAAKPAAKPVPAKKVAAKKAAPAKKAPVPKLAPAQKIVAKAVASGAPPAKAAAPPKPVRLRRPKFSPNELEAVRQELLDHRATYEKEFDDLESGSLNVSQSEMSGEVSYDEEFADSGTFTFERERDLSLSNNIRDLMDKVDSAMRKLDEGTYGVCERCGNAIDKARLKALPYSVLCISCKQQEERIR